MGDVPMPTFPGLPKLPDINLPDFPGRKKDLPPLPLPEKPGDSAQYPEAADKILRDLANKVNLPQVKEKLDYVKKMLGDFGKVQRIADTWAKDATMNDAKLEIDQARQDLSGYWEGRAFDAFNTHAISASGVHGTNQGALQGLGNSLAQCMATIFEAYKSAIKLIFNTAADALSLGLGGIFLGDKAAGKAIDLLTNFVKNVGDLIASALGTLRGLKVQSVYLTGVATQFQNLPESPQQASASGLWQVKPVTS